MDINEIKKLAELARIDMNEEELFQYTEDFQKILEYIQIIRRAPVEDESEFLFERNLFPKENRLRDDGYSYEGGEFREDLISASPEKQDYYIKVKKVL